MNKFYDVHNTGHKNAKSWFIIAKNKDDAFRIASTKHGTPTKIHKLNSNQDNIQELIDSEKTGILAKQLIGYTADQMFGLKSKPSQSQKPWFFTEEI